MKIYVRGELTPYQNISSNIFAYRWLCRNFMSGTSRREQYMAEKYRDNLVWKEKETFPVQLEQKADGLREDALRALTYVNRTIASPIGSTLQLYGYVNVILEGPGGIKVFNAHIDDTEILYRELSQEWLSIERLSLLPPESVPIRVVENNEENVLILKRKESNLALGSI